MRSVHIHVLGVGFVVGMLALGTMLSAIGFRWQESTFLAAGAGATGGHAAAPATGGSQATSQGQALFQQKCSSCHSIGGGRRVGPDLKGIADRRAHDWLVEFIVNPEQVHARNDPIAMELQKEYGMAMPNVGVTNPQTEEILAFIKASS